MAVNAGEIGKLACSLCSTDGRKVAEVNGYHSGQGEVYCQGFLNIFIGMLHCIML
jgi:hypothetical protein